MHAAAHAQGHGMRHAVCASPRLSPPFFHFSFYHFDKVGKVFVRVRHHLHRRGNAPAHVAAQPGKWGEQQGTCVRGKVHRQHTRLLRSAGRARA